MANAYLMTLKNIGIDESDSSKLKTLTLTVTDSGSAVTGLENFFIVQDTSDDTAVVVTSAAVDSTSDWTVTFTTSLDNTKSVRVQVLDTTNSKDSDRLFIDFNAEVQSGSIDIPYTIPTQEGSYKLGMDLPSVSDFDPEITTETVTVSANKPDNTNSSVALSNYKPYLTYFEGDILTVTATIRDDQDANADGNFEFTVSGNLQ